MRSVSRIATSQVTASSRSRISTRASIRSQLHASMASATRVVIKAGDKGLWKAQQNEETAAKVSALLQTDLVKHHVYFNPAGYHDHTKLTHQLLTLYSTGASPSILQAAFDANKTYQHEQLPPQQHVVAELQSDWAGHAPKYLGRANHYADFLRFFQGEIDQRGWQAVVASFLCADGPPARDMVQRLFSGVVHPMIQLGFGLEWEQPAIIASGLAQAAVHRNVLGDFYDGVDEAASLRGASGRGRGRGLSDMCENLPRENAKLVHAAEWHDGDQRMSSGVLRRGLEDAIALCASIRVREDDYDERLAETIHHGAYVAASAAWHPPFIPKYDFHLIHSLNASMFLLCLDKPCFPLAARMRILEYKMRYDVVQYVARGSPTLSPSHIRNYDPLGEKLVSRPEHLLPRYHDVVDDGHTIKVARSLLLAQQLSRKWKGKAWIRLDDDDDWLKAHYMLLKGVEGQEPLWIRGAGFDQAWAGVPKL